MQYQNGAEYTFESNGCKAHVTLENFKPETKEKFNQVLAREKLKEYKESKSEDVGA